MENAAYNKRMSADAKRTERDLVTEKAGEWHRIWRDYIRRLNEISRDALSNDRAAARFLDGLRVDLYTIERNFRLAYEYDPVDGKLRPRQAEAFTDTRQVSLFFSAVLDWTILRRATASAETVFRSTTLRMSGQEKLRMATRRALAQLCTPHAHMTELLHTPFEFIGELAAAALAGWTAAKVSLYKNATIKNILIAEERRGEKPDSGRVFEQLLSRLPAGVVQTFDGSEHGTRLSREVAENALTNLVEGRTPSAGGDFVATKVARFLEKELREGQWAVKRPIPVVQIPETISDDLFLYENSCGEDDRQEGLRAFVEKATNLLTATENRVFQLLKEKPHMKAVEIARELGITQSAVSQIMKNIRRKLTQAGLKEFAWEQLG